MQKLTHQQLLDRQKNCSEKALKIPVVAVLNNIRSLHNVGSLFRTADAAGLSKLWLCGITGIPPDSKISKTALGAEKHVPWEFCADALSCVSKLKAEGFEIVLLEQTSKSISYDSFVPSGKTCLVIGNEVAGVSDELLALSDRAIEIEMVGLKNSLNVTVAFGITVYHLRHCFISGQSGS